MAWETMERLNDTEKRDIDYLHFGGFILVGLVDDFFADALPANDDTAALCETINALSIADPMIRKQLIELRTVIIEENGGEKSGREYFLKQSEPRAILFREKGRNGKDRIYGTYDVKNVSWRFCRPDSNSEQAIAVRKMFDEKNLIQLEKESERKRALIAIETGNEYQEGDNIDLIGMFSTGK